MCPDYLKDARTGNTAKVNTDGQLITRATAVEQRLISTVDKNYYEATTAQITLTDTTETGIIYIKNLEDFVLVIDRVFYDIWESTGGSNGGILKYYRNPTVTGGSAIVPYNTNFESSSEIEATSLKSLTTMTGDFWWTAYISAGTSSALEEGRIVLPKGRSFGISVAAPTGNTSMKVSINVAMYLLDIDLLS